MKFNLGYHFYADDSQLYLSIEPLYVHDLIFNLEQCLNDVKKWMIVNRLKFNDDKTEVMLVNPKYYAIEQDYMDIGNEKTFG